MPKYFQNWNQVLGHFGIGATVYTRNENSGTLYTIQLGEQEMLIHTSLFQTPYSVTYAESQPGQIVILDASEVGENERAMPLDPNVKLDGIPFEAVQNTLIADKPKVQQDLSIAERIALLASKITVDEPLTQFQADLLLSIKNNPEEWIQFVTDVQNGRFTNVKKEL